MVVDDTFRWMLAAVLFTLLPFAFYHRIRSNLTGEQLDRWQEGAFMLFGLRLSGLPWFIGWIVWMIDPELMRWSSLALPIWLRWCGFSLIAVWGFLLAWTFQSLGKNLTDTVVTRRAHTLVTTGPYRYVRHPFYLALFFAVIGGGMVAANWFLLLTGMLPLAFLIVRTRTEERKLIERFGDDYRGYMARTGRFFPRFHRPTTQ